GLSYDPAQASGPVVLEIDWDHPGPPEAGFVARSRIECAPDPGFPEPCTDTSPPYATAGARQVVLRVTDSGSGASALSAQTITVAEKPKAYCEPLAAGEQCGPGNGRKTPGGGGKVSHKGWPRITGILWSVQESGRGTHSHTGGPLNDELLGHHGSD